MKVRIILKAKEDFGSIKEGENLVMENHSSMPVCHYPKHIGAW
jgi:hypothetical protein